MPRTNGEPPLLPLPTPTPTPMPRTIEGFLRAIAGDADWGRVHVTGFAGDPEDPPPGAWGGGPAATWPWTPTDNQYFAVSLFHGNRGSRRRWNAGWCSGWTTSAPRSDATGAGPAGRAQLRIETSPGNEQWGYVLGGAPISDAAWAGAFIKSLVTALVGEDARIPGCGCHPLSEVAVRA